MAVIKNITIKDSVFDPFSSTLEKKVSYFKGRDKRILYKVWIYLEGADIYYVDYVIYNLHSSFKEPQRKVTRNISNQNCTLIIWTWGVFELKTKVFFKTGDVLEVGHYLTYDRQLRNPGLDLVNTGSISE